MSSTPPGISITWHFNLPMNGSCDQQGTILEDVELFSSLVYGIISIVLYMSHIRMIVRKSFFHHPFFFQYVLLSIVNIVLWLDVFLMQRVIPHPTLCSFFFPDFAYNSLSMKMLLMFYYIPLTIQIFTVIVISINRMSVVLYPITAPKLWSRYVAHTIVLILLATALYCSYLYTWKVSLLFNNLGRLLLNFVDGWPHIPLALMPAVISVLCFLVILITTTVTLANIYKHNVQVANADVNLFWTGFGFSLTTSLVTVYSIALYVYLYVMRDSYTARYILAVKGWAFDINCLLPAWLLVFTNRHVRSYLLKKKAGSIPISAFSDRKSRN